MTGLSSTNIFIQAYDPRYLDAGENAASRSADLSRAADALPMLAGCFGSFSLWAIVWTMLLINVEVLGERRRARRGAIGGLGSGPAGSGWGVDACCPASSPKARAHSLTSIRSIVMSSMGRS
jgi:hypothetical protein